MSKKFKDMETPEQQYARQAAQRPQRPTGDVSNSQWRSMDSYEQAAYLARSDGREDDARKHEQARAERLDPPKAKKWWGRR
jgi:hypothetical protein